MFLTSKVDPETDRCRMRKETYFIDIHCVLTRELSVAVPGFRRTDQAPSLL